MNEKNDNKLKHLEFIQDVITRMNSNSFIIKGWMITLVSALFALAAKDSNIQYVFLTYIAIPAFWILDGFSLSQERQYRAFYNDIRKKIDTDFSMNASFYNNGENTWFGSSVSKTLLVFYGIVLAITLFIMFALNWR